MYQRKIKSVLEELKNSRAEIIDILNKIESKETANTEYDSAIDCLEKAYLEKEFWGNNIPQFAAFMPVNLPLNSLILGLMSSLAAKETNIRPASDTRNIVAEISRLLLLEYYFPNFHIRLDDRQTFLDRFVQTADAVYFVGEFNNAKKVQETAKANALFLYSGTGINPFIVTEDADISLSVTKALNAGLFNSGQDCGRPKIHLVHKSVVDQFLEELKWHLDKVICDDYSNSDAQVGPLLRDSVVQDAMTTLLKYRDNIYHDNSGHPCGGFVDLSRKIVYPTILKVEPTHKLAFKEFYAPIFTVASYSDDEELSAYFKEDRYFFNAMYAFVFGSIPEHLNLSKNTVVIHNASLLDVEQGNQPFGGYGKHANYIFDGTKNEARPFLVSEELYEFGNKRRKRRIAGWV